ncbi:MAG: PIN domain-containing protein [Trueperaceae bacterium]|nr:PIN domain-containing protein [Trueperaceae bacterium]
MSVIADTSGLLALLDADHARHAEVRDLLLGNAFIVPSSVLPEIDHLATRRLGAKVAQTFLDDLVNGHYDFFSVSFDHVRRAHRLMVQYADADIGYVDASIVAVAEQLKIRRILTLDRRHFTMFRPQGLDYLELLP